MTPRPSVPFVVVNTLLVWLTTAVAATTFWPVYQHPQLIMLGDRHDRARLGHRDPRRGVPLAVLRRASWSRFGVFLLAGVPLAVPGRAIAGVLPVSTASSSC